MHDEPRSGPARRGQADTHGPTLSRAPQAGTSASTTPGLFSPGTVIGRYTIQRPIGVGGMGAVYAAEQDRPKRTVALKVIRGQQLSPELVRRFEQESRLLARLQHPGIAQVFDAGAAHGPGGEVLPYFVMELIEGEPLTADATARGLGIAARLELMTQVCDAVAHAHQKGVIHRDLKPGNILVDRSGRPRILDFGIARAADADGQHTIMHTDAGQIIGTLAYMSPEQVSGDPTDLDTRSDVYSLGVILYELLAARQPIDVRSRPLHEAARLIREVDPPPLSAFNRLFRGDIETIVARAMEKDKARRYQSAEALGTDLRRHLLNQVITARPATAWYQLSKFARRHRGLVGGLMAAGLVLAGGAAATASALVRALRAEETLTRQIGEVEQARAIASRERDAAEAAKEAEAQQRRIADAQRDAAEAAKVAEADQRRAADAQRDRATQAEARAAARASELERVADFQARMLRRANPTRAGKVLSNNVLRQYSEVVARVGISNEGAGARRRAFAEQWDLVNPTDLARDLIDQTILRPAVNALDRDFTDQFAVDARLRQVLADRYLDLGLYDAALPLQRRALETRRRVLGDDHPQTRESIRSMGDLLAAMGRLDEAAPLYREVTSKRPPRGEWAAARAALAAGDAAGAEKSLREDLARCRASSKDDNLVTVRSLNRLATFLHGQGRNGEAEPLFVEAVEIARGVRRTDSPDAIESIRALGAFLLDEGRAKEAEPLLREAAASMRRVRGEAHPETLLALAGLAALHLAVGDPAQAVGVLAPAEPAIRAAYAGNNASMLGLFLLDLGQARTGVRHFNDAETNLLEAHALLAPSSSHADESRSAARALADLYTLWHTASPGAGHAKTAMLWRERAIGGE